MGSYSKTYRATAAPSVGANWSNAANIYDSDVNSYASRSTTSTSATHINGFGINLPSNAAVNSIDVCTKVYSANEDGYIAIYVYSDSGPTRLTYTKVVDGGKFSAQYVTHTYTAEQLTTWLNENGIHEGNLVEFLKNLRVRFVIGDAGDSVIYTGNCRIYDNYVVVNYSIPDYTLTVKAGVGGSVTGGGTYESGKTATLTATAHTGYTFKQWSDGNTNATRTVTVTKKATYTAQFEPIKYTITTAVTPDGSGTVSGGGSYDYATTATLTAVPNAGYAFKQWSDGNIYQTRTVTVSGDATYTAIFELDKINKIYIGTQQPKEIYVGTTPIKAIYVGTTKVYG